MKQSRYKIRYIAYNIVRDTHSKHTYLSITEGKSNNLEN